MAFIVLFRWYVVIKVVFLVDMRKLELGFDREKLQRWLMRESGHHPVEILRLIML